MNDYVFPQPLKQGDKVILLSPSGKIDESLVRGACKVLTSWGLIPEVSRHALAVKGLYAGTRKERLHDLQRAMNDKEAKAILCTRGGYGAVHLMGDLCFDAFREHPKWLIGFSDITALHCLFQSQGFASLHAPMARHLALEPQGDPCAEYLRQILFGTLPTYQCAGHKLNKEGTATGILRGGNLAVAYGLRATPYDIPPEGTILFLEDVGERPHSVERMFYNLKLGGVLERVSGIIIGQFTEFEEKKQLGKPLYGALADLLKEYDIPVCFNFPVGHVTDNRPLICGAPVELTVDKKNVTLKIME